MTSDSKATWLAVDVGNSRVKFGLFSDRLEPCPSHTPGHSLPECCGFHTAPLKSEFDWDSVCAGDISNSSLRGVIVGSNQQGVDRVVNEWPAALPPPVVIRDSDAFPIAVDVDEPQRVGLDRLLNAIAANVIRQTSDDAVIVDCGTATTVDLVSNDGAFCGGAILPGFTLCAKALNRYTEVLPLISLKELFALPVSEDCPSPLGRNTQAAIMSGVFWGQIGAVRELTVRLGRFGITQAGSNSGTDSASSIADRHRTLLLTGGGSRLLVPYFPEAIHCPYLPLQGLVLAAAAMQDA